MVLREFLKPSLEIHFHIFTPRFARVSPADAEGGVHDERAVRLVVELLQVVHALVSAAGVGRARGQHGLQQESTVTVTVTVSQRRVTRRLQHGDVTGTPRQVTRNRSHLLDWNVNHALISDKRMVFVKVHRYRC